MFENTTNWWNSSVFHSPPCPLQKKSSISKNLLFLEWFCGNTNLHFSITEVELTLRGGLNQWCPMQHHQTSSIGKWSSPLRSISSLKHVFYVTVNVMLPMSFRDFKWNNTGSVQQEFEHFILSRPWVGFEPMISHAQPSDLQHRQVVWPLTLLWSYVSDKDRLGTIFNIRG